MAHSLIGRSPLIDGVRRLIDKASRNRLPVLLSGESGTGKEIVARCLHQANPTGEFVTIDCGSLVGTLMESELFGHTKGAFTNAVENKKGLVDLADGGTAFFDEIGDLPLEMQVKLLRLIQEREFRPVGATTWKKVDIRIIAATHRDLKAEVAAGRFRLDLFYRLNVFSIRLPALRERKEDIPLLIDHFLKQSPDLPPFQPSRELMDMLMAYDWPGNVRELQHCIERLAALHTDGVLQLADLPSPFQNHIDNTALDRLSRAVAAGSSTAAPPVLTRADSERRAIAAALDAAKGHRIRAAGLLGMSRTTLYRRMKQYGMD